MATVTLVDTSCCCCGIVFAVPNDWDRKRREDGAEFYCPNGHSLAYRDTEVQRLKKKLEEATRDAASLRAQRDLAEKNLDLERAAAKRVTHRISCGVCPKCHRTFQNVQRHMKTKHEVAP